MLTETARVVAVEDGSIWVETVRQSVCGSCAAQKGCGHGIMNQIGDGTRNYLQLSATKFPSGRFKVDDQVTIGIPEKLMVAGSALVYVIPLIGMLGGAALMPLLVGAGSELSAMLGAGLGLVAGFAAVRLHAWYYRNSNALQPELLGLAPSLGD